MDTTGKKDNNLSSLQEEMHLIERELMQQLALIENSIDKRFEVLDMSFGSANENGAVSLSSQAAGIVAAAAIIVTYPIIGIIGEIKKAKERNRRLEELLQIKQKIAADKMPHLVKIEELCIKTRNKISQLILSGADYEYDLDRLERDHAAEVTKGNLCTQAELLRNAYHTENIVKYLIEEYKAWLAGKQMSRFSQPTLLHANKQVIETLGKNPSIDNPTFRATPTLKKQLSSYCRILC